MKHCFRNNWGNAFIEDSMVLGAFENFGYDITQLHLVFVNKENASL